ncbi:MAG: pyridoxal-phosphate dependent enzyme [Candidatus Obscuribacterales bacterium]|nr:pyridoxal-phosphate dependent enzyme [Candidatus Obscuribacterales bacterium]
MTLTSIGAIRPVTIIESEKLSRSARVNLIIATETFQTTGSFKFRAAYNVCSSVAEETLITASSGNFGQAMACACLMLGKKAIIVMPSNSAKVKVDATRSYGAVVDLVDTKVKSRAQRVAELAAENPGARVCSAYDDPLVIDGNASLGREMGLLTRAFDVVVVPVGGGGLAAGVVNGLKQSNRNVQVYGAEPLLANDAAQSLRTGAVVRLDHEPQTIADGARTVSLGAHNWEILKHGLTGILEVSEEKIAEALRRYFFEVNLKVEPTGALALGAVLSNPALFADKTVVCIVSGGNVDSDTYSRILNESGAR